MQSSQNDWQYSQHVTAGSSGSQWSAKWINVGPQAYHPPFVLRTCASCMLVAASVVYKRFCEFVNFGFLNGWKSNKNAEKHEHCVNAQIVVNSILLAPVLPAFLYVMGNLAATWVKYTWTGNYRKHHPKTQKPQKPQKHPNCEIPKLKNESKLKKKARET